MARLKREAPEKLKQEFIGLARQWRAETGMMSFIGQKAMHPAYQKIIGMGKDALPFIFLELRHGGADWLWALEAIARPKVHPALRKPNFNDAVAAWLRWGKENGYL